MRSTLLRAAGAIALAAVVASTAFAQSPAVNPREADFAKQQQQQQALQPLNNQPVWKEVRSGLPQVTSLPGRETNVLIQGAGHEWRKIRNGIVTFWGGIILLPVYLYMLYLLL